MSSTKYSKTSDSGPSEIGTSGKNSHNKVLLHVHLCFSHPFRPINIIDFSTKDTFQGPN